MINLRNEIANAVTDMILVLNKAKRVHICEIVFQFIRERGQVSRSELSRNMFPRGITPKMLTEVLPLLIEAELVETQIIKNKDEGRDTVIYKYVEGGRND